MSDDLIFMMGSYEARFPQDRNYVESHLWFQPQGEVYRVGFTAYSVRLLQDVYFLDWTVDADTAVRKKQEVGEVESSKALSTLYAPADGRLVAFNDAVLDDPSLINTDNYGAGWLFEFATEAPTLAPAEYLELLDAGWEATQRIIKGQMND
ncbi:Glycine cleavage system H protein [Symmachiella dynata]|uniref:glycine cleavage system protein H n=1 Tax=Symmachiella dynata TaxID=2527995 RepID=UPI00118B9C67|nr:glycine cleavage system protein H [Symmachiella dynata]QDT50744.1 Glycine cleavage system H protein [Symmachiella dynata]